MKIVFMLYIKQPDDICKSQNQHHSISAILHTTHNYVCCGTWLMKVEVRNILTDFTQRRNKKFTRFINASESVCDTCAHSHVDFNYFQLWHNAWKHVRKPSYLTKQCIPKD